MKDEELYDKIDRYLAGKLEDSQRFESEIANDKDLQQAVQLEKTLRDAVIDHSVLQTRKELESIRNEVAKETKQNNFWKWTGSLLLVSSSFIAATLYFQNDRPLENKATIPSNNFSSNETELSISKVNVVEDKFTGSSPKTLTVSKTKQHQPNNPIENDSVIEKTPLKVLVEDRVEASRKITENEQEKTEAKLDDRETKNTSEKPQTISEPKSTEKMTDNSAVKRLENHIFEPTSETWNIPIAENKSGMFTVIDKAGEIVYKKAFGMNEEAHWDGYSSKGALLKAGLYGYVLDYMDGSVEQGTITLSY